MVRSATRHISATNMIDNGTPEQVVMTVAGWKTNMLRDYYHRESKRAMELIEWGTCETSVKRDHECVKVLIFSLISLFLGFLNMVLM